MRVWRIITFASFLILIILVATACNPNQSQVQQQPVQAVKGDLTIKANGSGKVGVDTDATPSFGNGGKISKLYIKEGDTITKGSVLAQLETDNLELALLQAKVTEAQAQVALTQAQLAQTQSQSGVSQAEASLTAAQFNLDKTTAVSDIKDKIMDLEMTIKAATVNLTQAQATNDTVSGNYLNHYIADINSELDKENKNLQDLLAKDEYTGTAPYEVKGYDITSGTYDIGGQRYNRLVVEDVRMKQQQVEIAQQSVEQAKQTVEQATQNIEQAKQSLEETTKAVEVAQKQLNDATIIAPIDGIAVTVNVKEGDTVPSSSINPTTPIYLIDISSMQVSAQIDEIDIPGVKLGQDVIISLDSAPDMQYAGKVKSISMAPVANPQNSGVVVYEVKAGFVNPPPPEVKLGMSATVDIITNEHKDVLLIPSRAIKEDNQGNPVVDVKVNQKIETRPVKVGISDGLNTEITSGLNAGETVIITRTTGNLGLFGQ